VLPGDARVFLVHTDGVGDGDRVAVLIVDDPVEVTDAPDAVATQSQGIGEPADAATATSRADNGSSG
jgi:hypothetical protein